MSYQVRTTRTVAKEMSRYENNYIVSERYPRCQEQFQGTDLERHYTEYTFVISGEPNVERWLSFGVHNIVRLQGETITLAFGDDMENSFDCETNQAFDYLQRRDDITGTVTKFCEEPDDLTYVGVQNSAGNAWLYCYRSHEHPKLWLVYCVSDEHFKDSSITGFQADGVIDAACNLLSIRDTINHIAESYNDEVNELVHKEARMNPPELNEGEVISHLRKELKNDQNQ